LSEHPFPPTEVRGALISDHPHPRPALRQITAGLLALGLIGDAFGVVGLVVAGIGLGLPLLPLMAVFLAILAAPLVLLTVLHPRITVYECGLWVRPLLWRGCWIGWEAIARIEDHTLIQRSKRTRWEKTREGHLIVVDEGLPRAFEVVGIMGGLGRVRAFGIAMHSHVEYTALLNAIQRRKHGSR
jgi:hypothetical protein